MPRKPRITAVPVEQVQPEEGLMIARDVPDEKTDAEQMTDIIQEVKEEPKADIEQVLFEVPFVTPVLPVIEKLKAKRASRAKPILTLQVSDQREEEPGKEEPKKELKEEARIDDQVACPDCGKQMSAKTLKYSHVANCVTKKQKTKTEKTDEQQYPTQVGEITEDLIEHHIRTRSRAARALRRETMMNNLVQSAF